MSSRRQEPLKVGDLVSFEIPGRRVVGEVIFREKQRLGDSPLTYGL